MAAKTIDGVRFNVYSNDHDPPHVDAEVDGKKLKMVFESETHFPYIRSKDPRIKRQDAKRAFAIFIENQGTLRAMFDEVQNAKKDR